jgi:hypothetical protein
MGSICTLEEISESLSEGGICTGSGITTVLVCLKSREIKSTIMNPSPIRFKPS